jgi:glycosyltransferase A (GT-A) superfamily protein (DUF2064 family)
VSAPVVLVVAKVPIPGQVKTRLAATEGPVRAALLAAAALLDTLDACEQAFGLARCHVALAGELGRLADGELATRLAAWHVHPQRGAGLGARIANAHRDVHLATRAPVVQLGMDTPQVSPVLLRSVAVAVAVAAHRPVLGLADDGGWWLLATCLASQVDGLEEVPMSTPGTGLATWQLLRAGGVHVGVAPLLRDVDKAADAEHVATLAPATRFAQTWRAGRAA